MNGEVLLKDLMLRNSTPVYFIDWCLFTALGMEAYIGNIHFICAIDTFEGIHPNIFVPKSFEYDHSLTCEQTLNALLVNDEVVNYIKFNGPGKLLTWLLDEESERLASRLGLEICLPSVSLRHQWDNKANTNRLAEKAGVPCVPYILSPVNDYAHLTNISAHLCKHLVVQMPHGCGGQTTFFISSEADFEMHKADITNSEEMKIMTRIQCRGASLEACITRHGVAVSPLLFELIGIPEINIYRGGWSGDEFFPYAFPENMIQLAKEYSIKLGEELRKVGYKGYFQPDFLIDQDTNTLYLGEMNLRFSGFTPLINNANIAEQDIPLFVLHLAEWMDFDYHIDIDALNERWTDQHHLEALSFLHVKNVNDSLARPIPTGIYRLNEDGTVVKVRNATCPRFIENVDEIFWFSTAGKHSIIKFGDELGGLFIWGRVTTDGKELTSKAKAWINGLLALDDIHSVEGR